MVRAASILPRSFIQHVIYFNSMAGSHQDTHWYLHTSSTLTEGYTHYWDQNKLSFLISSSDQFVVMSLSLIQKHCFPDSKIADYTYYTFLTRY